jgi:hypothetical protein
LFSIVERRSNIDIDIPAIAFHSLVLAILSNSCRRNVTDPEHERPFGKAMLPGGTEALCLCPESLRLAAQIKNLFRTSATSAYPRFPRILHLRLRLCRAVKSAL